MKLKHLHSYSFLNLLRTHIWTKRFGFVSNVLLSTHTYINTSCLVAALQKACTDTTRCLYWHYKMLVLTLQDVLYWSRSKLTGTTTIINGLKPITYAQCKVSPEAARTMLLFANEAGDAEEGMYWEVVMTAIGTASPSALAAQRCRRGRCLRY